MNNQKKVQVIRMDMSPEPKVGDIFIMATASGDEGKTYIISSCTCGSAPKDKLTLWPNGTGCGAHLIPEGGTKSIGSICWVGGSLGHWVMNGWLIRREEISSNNCSKLEFNRTELKEQNTNPEAICCCNCGGALKKPFPTDSTYNYCPICEP
jgi:hypothetical protein